MEIYKGEKYIYLLMGYQKAKENGGVAHIGEDNNRKGGQNYYRRFTIREHGGKTLLTETKNSPNFAEFSRTFIVADYGNKTPTIYEYIPNGDNYSKNWLH